MPGPMRRGPRPFAGVAPTRAAYTDELFEHGVKGAARDFMVEQTAYLRHEARVSEVRGTLSHLTPLQRAAVALADAHGVGGRGDVEGLSALRLPVFEGLPSRHAPSAGAWDAAIHEACGLVDGSIRLDGEWIRVEFVADGGKLYAQAGDLREEVSSELIPARWQRAVAGRKLRNDLLFPWRGGVGLKEWVALFNAAHERTLSDGVNV